MFLMGGTSIAVAASQAAVGTAAGSLSALTVSGNHLINEDGLTLRPRGVNTEGVANFRAFYPGGINPYVDRLVGIDADAVQWTPTIVRGNFERFPCADPTRLYALGDPRIVYCIPDTSTFTAWPAATSVVEGGLYTFGGISYSANKRYWRADRGFDWNPGHYLVGDRVVGLPEGTSHVYQCTAFGTTLDADWGGGPSGTSSPQTDVLGNTWAYIGEWGTTGASQPFGGSSVSDFYGTFFTDNLVTWSTVGPDGTPAEKETAWTNWSVDELDVFCQRCVDNEVYAIICDFDFGSADLPLRNARMMAFWDRISRSKWANCPNILFDLWNESTDVGGFHGWTWDNQKPYIQACVDMIRANGATNVILCTTPAFCAYTHLATASPLTGTNIMYASHLYSDYFSTTSNPDYLNTALASGQAVMCSEFGSNHESDVTITDTFLNSLMGQIEPSRGSLTPAAAWAAWSFSRYWSPVFFTNDLYTTTTYYGRSIRDLFTEFAAADVAAGIIGTSGVWVDVTPAGLSLATNVESSPNWSGHHGAGSIDAYGVAAVIVDPTRPNVLYQGADNQGFWKSTNYGETWARVNIGTGGNLIDGFAWSIAPSADGTYILANNGYGTTVGVYKSTDGGVSWALKFAADVNVVLANPFDATHAIITPHFSYGDDHYYETTDSGNTWVDIGTYSVGRSSDGAFLNSTTIILMSPNGLYQLHKSSGTWTSTKVKNMTGPHGGVTMYRDATNGYFYVGGQDSDTFAGIIARCLISGGGAFGTWATVHSNSFSFGPSSIVGTPNYLYAQGTYATHTTIGSPYGPLSFRVTPAAAGSQWPDFTLPAGIHNGANRLAATTDGTRWTVVGANVNAGTWRWIE